MLILHMLFVFIWAVLLVSFAKSLECKPSKVLGILSFIFMLLVLGAGTKLMLAFPSIAKSGIWIHIKLSLDIIAMLINTYLLFVVFKQKNISQRFISIIFWGLILIFVLMYALTLFKPF